MVVLVPAHVPAREELAHDDAHERDRVFEAGTVVHGLGVPVHAEEADGDDGCWDCVHSAELSGNDEMR